MKIDYLIVSDYANSTADEKMNIMGIFSLLNVTELPARHPVMYVSFRISGMDFFNKDHRIHIAIRQPDDVVLFEVNGDVEPPTGRTEVGIVGTLAINDTIFKTDGIHVLTMTIDSEVSATYPIAVVKRDQQPQ